MELEFCPEFTDVRERWRRLWELEPPLDRVPAIVSLPRPPGKKADGTFYGRPADYLNYMEKCFAEQAKAGDDSAPCLSPVFGHALIAGLLGAPIKAESETVWVEPILESPASGTNLTLDWDNDIGRIYREELAVQLEWARGKAVVSTYEVEGVADTMSALRGAQNLLYDMIDEPNMINNFASRVAEILIEFGRWQNKNVAEKQPEIGGTVVDWKLWMPPGSICMAEDATVMMSPRTYREHIQQHDRVVAESFSDVLLEVHPEGNHLLSELGKVDGFSGFAISPPPIRMDEANLNQIKPMFGEKVFYIAVKPQEIESTLEMTGAVGVCLVAGAPTARAARDILDRIEAATQSAMKKR